MPKRKAPTTPERQAWFEDALKRIQLVTCCRTQIQLAEFLDVRQSSISDAKRRSSIPPEWLLRIMDKTNVNPNWITNGDDEPKYRVPNEESGHVLNVRELRQRIETQVRDELDNLHAEDMLHRLKAMGLSVSVRTHDTKEAA